MAGPPSPATASSRPSSSTRSASPTTDARCSHSPRAACTARPTRSIDRQTVGRRGPPMARRSRSGSPSHSSNEDDGARPQSTLWETAAVAAPPPHHVGHRKRLRDRFRKGGADALPDYELIELILFRALPQGDTKPLAKALLARFGSFPDVLNASEARLREVSGVGERVV